MSWTRAWLASLLAASMLVTSTGIYLFLAAHQSAIRAKPKTPLQVPAPPPALLLPGTLFLVQDGAIYSLSGGRFRQLSPSQGWVQVAAIPDGSGLLAVKRSADYSDLYRLGLDGHVVSRLTDNAAPSRFSDIGANHWSFYPSVQPGTTNVFMSYDSGKQFDFEVDMAIWELPLSGLKSQWRQWTVPNSYTGGDTQPLPLASGGLIYVKYDQDDSGNKASQLWYRAVRGGPEKALTSMAEDCSQPALSPDGHTLAMVCSGQQQQSQLVLADLQGGVLGPRRAVVTTQLVAQPAWAPDGSGIAFMAPIHPDRPFQLWWLPRAAYAPEPSPSPAAPSPPVSAGRSPGRSPSPAARVQPSPVPAGPIEITSDLGLDATSPIAWRP